MRKTNLIFSVLLLASTANVQAVEQTICFAKSSCSNKYAYGLLGDNVQLCGGKCQGVKLATMNRRGWRLIQVISGLDSSFGMVFERVGKRRR